MEPSKKCTYVPKMIYFTKPAKNPKWEPSKFLTILYHNGTVNTGNHMEPSKNALLFQK